MAPDAWFFAIFRFFRLRLGSFPQNREVNARVCDTCPRFMRLAARFYVRGGIFTTVTAEFRRKGWRPAPAVDLGSLPLRSPAT
jgi:hypothetical protein